MKEYLCTETMIPLRTDPSHRAEMGSQILHGERFRIIDKAGSWSKIELIFDSYSGWVDNDHVQFFESPETGETIVITENINARFPDGSMITLYTGSEIYDIDDSGQRFRSANRILSADINIAAKPEHKDIVGMALTFINAPYMWGGRIIHGIDCSGLSQICYKSVGKSIPRDSFNQALVGTTINMLSDAQPGDLLFFDNSSGKITHVGILYDSDHIIHASGRVRIDPVDHQGIFRHDIDDYSHKLRIIKRI